MKPSWHDNGCKAAIDEAQLCITQLMAKQILLVREIEGRIMECREVEQILGQALGYPWFKDDQKNFPGATEADGVCIGEHAAGTIAVEAARRIKQLSDAIREECERTCSYRNTKQYTYKHNTECLAIKLGLITEDFKP